MYTRFQTRTVVETIDSSSAGLEIDGKWAAEGKGKERDSFVALVFIARNEMRGACQICRGCQVVAVQFWVLLLSRGTCEICNKDMRDLVVIGIQHADDARECNGIGVIGKPTLRSPKRDVRNVCSFWMESYFKNLIIYEW